MKTDGNLLPARDVLARYQVVERTISRWLADPSMSFPEPIKIRQRRYWREADLLAWERTRATTRPAA